MRASLATRRRVASHAMVDRDGRVTRQGLALEAGVSSRTAGRLLAELLARGVVVPDGRKGMADGYVGVGRLCES